MKITIAVDQLLERDISTSMVETLLSLGHEVELVTLCYKKGNITGPIFYHRIVSTYLSLFFKKAKSLFRFPNLSYAAAKNFKVPDADFYLVLSRGFIHHVKTDPNKPRVNYYFGDLGNHHSLKVVSGLNLFCSRALANQYTDHGKFEIIPPPFISRDFPVMGRYYDNKSVLLKIPEQEIPILDRFINRLEDEYQIRVICDDKKTSYKIKALHPEVETIIAPSNGEFYIELLKTFLYIDLGQEFFPEKAFCSLCTGVPCFVLNDEVNKEFLTEDVVSFISNPDSIFEELDRFLSAEKIFKPEILRRFALRFNERIFKNRFLKFVKMVEGDKSLRV